MRRLVAGNWKMNGTRASAASLARAVADAAGGLGCDVVLCPPATLLAEVAGLLMGSKAQAGGQDCHAEASGAFTGDVSAAMLRDAGARWVVLGHSERRLLHGETNLAVREKVEAAMAAGLRPIVCVGETEQQRLSGGADTVVAAQVDGSLPPDFAGVVAYEPIWAIGTGRSAEAADVEAMHAVIRHQLRDTLGAAGDEVRILYGGSVKPAGAAALFGVPGVDGALVGGASLVAADFLAIAAAASSPG